MKKFLLAALILVLSASALASQIQKADKKEVDKAFTAWREALSSGKAENIVALYDEKAVLLATLNNEPIDNQKARLKYFKKLTEKPKLQAKVNEEDIRVLDDNTAVVSGIYTFSFDDEQGKEVKIPARYSFVFEKENGKWVIINHHSSKLPN